MFKAGVCKPLGLGDTTFLTGVCCMKTENVTVIQLPNNLLPANAL